MKKITAYVNTLRVHWLVEGLQAAGVSEIMVTEYFRPLSQISRLQCCCEDGEVDHLSEIVHRLGSTGTPPDHNINVEEFDPSLASQFPIGMRASRLEESRIKQLIDSLFRGLTAKLSLGFLFISVSIVMVGLFINVRIGSFQMSARGARETVQRISDSTQKVSGAIIEEMTALERLHDGDTKLATSDFRLARVRLNEAVLGLRGLTAVNSGKLDSLQNVAQQFQTSAEQMFVLVGRGLPGAEGLVSQTSARLSAHARMMAGLDDLHLTMMDIMYSLQVEANALGIREEADNDKAMDGVRLSLTLLASGAMLITIIAWLFVERNIGRPLQMIVEEAKNIDTGQLW